MTLYEIDKQLIEFEYQFDEETGEMLNAMELDTLEMERREKIENVCCFIKNLKADCDEFKKEIEALSDRMKKKQKKAEGLEDYLKYCLGGETFESTKAQVTYKKSTETSITDMTKIPEKYLITTTTTRPDKNSIKAAIKSGEVIEGAELVEKSNMHVK